MESESNNNGAAGDPRMFARELKAIAADSRSYPDFLLVANACRVLRIF